MNMKKLHLKSDQLNKRIKNLSQFESFYSSDEYCEKNDKINSINANDFNSLYKAKPNKILLIDVRENEEFSSSSIEGSISIPLSHFNQKSDLEFIQKESLIKEVFTICKTGKRSEKASKILSKFKIQSRSIEGGIEKVERLLRDEYFKSEYLVIYTSFQINSNICIMLMLSLIHISEPTRP